MKNVSITSLIFIFLSVFVLSDTYSAQNENAENNWNQFRGPNGDGKAIATDLPTEFSETENVRWKVPIHDKGYSSPIVWDNQIWVTTAREDGSELFAICIDLENGDILHDIKVFDVAEPQLEHADLNSHASPTPIVEEGRIYVHYGTYGTACLDTKTGEKLWERRDLNCDHRVRPASSPIIDEDTLFLTFDGVDVQFIAALNKNTGDTLWMQPRKVDSNFEDVLRSKGVKDIEATKKEKPNDNRKSYATPTIITYQGKKQLVSPAAEVTIAYDPKTGDELWRVRHEGWGWNVACRPIFAHNLVYFTTGVEKLLLAVDPSGSGDVTDTHIVWRNRKGAPEIPSPLIVDDLMFMVNEGGVVSCVDTKDGNAIWKGRIGGNHWASPLYAGGNIYFFSMEGRVSVIAAAREFKLLARNEFDDGFIASGAAADNALILRSLTHLYCIEKTKPLTYQNISFANNVDASKSSDRVDFENDLIPIFTKFGCNAGACHGAAAGRGEFKLSLFGGNPQADYEAIVRQLAGRRINLMHPEESLVILKPTAQTSHGGGQVLNENSEGARLLRNWIQQGARYETLRRLERVEISPQKHVITNLENPIQLRADAHFSDGTTEDVTRWTVFTPEDTSAVEIDASTAIAKLHRRGRHIILARYLTEVVPIEFIAPLNEVLPHSPIQKTKPETKWKATEERSTLIPKPTSPIRKENLKIDTEILKLLSTLRLPMSPAADDATFLRRVTLDLTGHLPTPDAVTSFLADSDTYKRETLVDRLLQSDAFNAYWTLQLAKLLRIGAQERNTQGAFVYHQWLSEQIREGIGYDQMARTIIFATGDSHEVGPANFYRTVNNPREQAEFMSELFMGARLRCANCHNHPLDKWTQDDYHGLAAIFAKIESDQIVKVKPSGEVIHPATREKAVPRIPGNRFLPADVPDGRAELAAWLTGSDNPYFAKAIVNRLWKAMMGRGLVEPVDDFRATNPATHPELLTELADDFVANGYDLRHTLRRIALSESYARSADTLPQNATDDRFYSHALQKPLEPEVLADAISDVLGISDTYGHEPKGTRAVSLFNPNTESEALDILGRCGRETSCESATEVTDGLQRKLHLFNGDLLNARIGVPGSRLDKLISEEKSPMEILDEFYLAALSRHLTETEQQFWEQHIDVNSSANSQRAILEDMVWSLLTCNEFVANH